jgi:hypothetical protein
MPPPPYPLIGRLLREGKVIPFLGAGVNIRSPVAGEAPDPGPALPTGAQLSRRLAKEVAYPADDDRDLTDLAKVASYFVEISARQRLCEALRQEFTVDAKPSPMHRYLASVPAPLLVVTTNYDDLMERAFIEAGRPYDLVVHPTDQREVEGSVLWWAHGASEPEAIAPNKLYIELEERSVIYKMHGSICRTSEKLESYVVTEEDYVDFLARMTGLHAVPAQFLHHFRRCHFLYLGYGLRDWNLRVMLRMLRMSGAGMGKGGTGGIDEGDQRLVSWAVQYRPSPIETELWGTRSVKIFDVAIDDFVQGLVAGGAV